MTATSPATDAAFLAETIDVLGRTAEMLRALLTGLPDSWASTPDVEGRWRPRDVVGHLARLPTLMVGAGGRV